MSLTDKRPRMPVHLEKDVGLKFTAALFTFTLTPWNEVFSPLRALSYSAASGA